ncbi:MAG TPA: hypothetical protein VN654_27650 [Vicinamibacterales bacterium]|jgi:hypothetical protein|nr:hypothetical protein [Vicinamibacterales bacterium]
MYKRLIVLVVLALVAAPGAWGQTRTAPKAPARAPARRAAPKPAPLPPLQTDPASITCPNPLGSGVRTGRMFCDVLTGREPADGILVEIPPHVGPVTLSFDLHNRHMYSEELIKSNRAYRRYTASIGVLTMDNTLVSRAVVQSEFRGASDLVDRIGGGAGPGGVKAVAPSGSEAIVIQIPETEERVSILGEKLAVERLDGVDNFSLPGQPVAIISNVMLEYRPAPPKRTPARRR